MNLRQLTGAEIEKLAARKGVKRIAVENFLASMGTGFPSDARQNLHADAESYKWNAATVKAILAGITLASKPAPIKKLKDTFPSDSDGKPQLKVIEGGLGYMQGRGAS